MIARDAIALYDDALRDGGFPGDDAIVLGGLVKDGLHYDGRPVCNVLRPLIVDASEKARLDRATELVARGIAIAAATVARDAALRKTLLLTEAQEDCVRFEDGDTSELFARIDGLIEPGGRLRFLEYNPFPSGFAWADGIAQRFEATTSFRACAARFELHCQRMVPHFVRSLLDHVSHIPSHGPRAIGLIVPAGTGESLDGFSETTLLLSAIATAGIEIRVSDPSGVALQGDALTVAGARVDAVFVAAWNELVFTEAGRRSPLWAARRARKVAFLDSMCSATLHGSKALFAILSDPAYDALFPSDVRDALQRHVPWTRGVVDGVTTYRNERVELVSTIRAHRRNLVIKPTRECGGVGVVLGWESTESEWDAAIAKALTEPHVVQERVVADTTNCPVAGEHGLEHRRLLFDWSPLVWRDSHAHGVLSRLGEQSILNVKAGASLVPVYTAGERSASANAVSPALARELA